jgi:hypothetical protein
MHACVAAALLSTAIAAPVQAQNLVCTDAANEARWVKKLVVDTKAKSVTLTLTQGPSPRTAAIANSSESQFGKPVYAFNLPPLEGMAQVTNVFKLFYTGTEWRLINAGLLEVNGVLTLRALGQSSRFECRDGA